MPIIFNQGSTVTQIGSNRINIPGRIVNFVDNTQTVSGTAGTGSWVNTLSTSITINNPGNRILVEYMMNDRSDQGNTWGLIYHRILCNGTQVMHSGYNGADTNHIGFYERTFVYNPPSIGTYTFVSQCLAYQGTIFFGAGNNGATSQYLRLYEIGS